jgi:hypothetical protein
MLDLPKHPAADIVLEYQHTKSKQVAILVFCAIVAVVTWTGAWASVHWHFATDPEAGDLRPILLGAAVIYTFFMLPLMIGSVWLQRRSFQKVVLGPTDITLPAKWWSRRPTRLAYSDILQIDEKLVAGSRHLKRIGLAFTALQVTHTKGRVAIIIENLSSPMDADLIVRTWVIRRKPADAR